MKHVLPARGYALAALMFALPLAALGFRVAAWGGVLAGSLVGAVIAMRLLMRGVTEVQGQPPPPVIISASDDTAEVDARRVARLKREFDAAVLESSDAVVSEPPLHR